MTAIESRFLLDGAMDSFRVQRARLDREGHGEAASELTVRAAGFLSDLAAEARKVLEDAAPPGRLSRSLGPGAEEPR